MTCTRTGGAPSAACPNKAPPAHPPGPRRCRGRPGKRSPGQCRPDLAHQMQIEVEVMQGGKLRAEHLAGQKEVAKRAAAEPPAGVARAIVLDGTRVAGV